MTEANISGTALPAFDRHPRGRRRDHDPRAAASAIAAKSPRSKSQPHPTFANTVLPLEQLSHRLSRTWSPISHLNGVLNSDELRASYNACLPLLSNYWTDLAQSEPLYRAYSAIAANESGPPRPGAAPPASSARSRISGSRASACRRSARTRYKAVVQELAQLGAKFEENVLDAMNAWTRHVTDEIELAGINPVIVEQARARAAEKGLAGLDVRARAAHLRRRHDRRGFGNAAPRFLRGLVHARVRTRARAPASSTTPP